MSDRRDGQGEGRAGISLINDPGQEATTLGEQAGTGLVAGVLPLHRHPYKSCTTIAETI